MISKKVALEESCFRVGLAPGLRTSILAPISRARVRPRRGLALASTKMAMTPSSLAILTAAIS